MDFLPLCLRLNGQSCLVVGGGEVAFRKTLLLFRANANITIISPEITETFQAWLKDEASQGSCTVNWHAKTFETSDLKAAHIIVAATNHRHINQSIAENARRENKMVNVVDLPEEGNFIFPAIIDRSPILISVSSSGTSPVLARLLRGRIESLIPSSYGNLAKLIGRYRSQVKAALPQINARRKFWEQCLQGSIAEMVFSGRERSAAKALENKIDKASKQEEDSVGEVYLVGAGPGDPDLLTFRALRLMQQADVVLYDRLVSKEILEMTRRDAQHIHVGKARSNHTVPQEEINERLVTLAKKGHRVLRLKGGDPFIFGRGGEEIDRLAQSGIPFQVVPGITAASGCASYSGIPLTHRDYSQSVRFVTGHLKNNTCDLPWHDLAQERQTLVFYMGLVGLPIICEELIKAGLSPSMPVALVQQGTTIHQKVFTGTLKTMPNIINTYQVKAPTLIIVGEVVTLRERLNWFDGGENIETDLS